MTAGRRWITARALGLLGLSCLAALSLVTAARAAAPANDEFGAATALPATLPGGVSGSNLEATKELGEPNHAGNAGGHSVWYSWTPSASGPVGITGSCFSAISPLVAVYTGPSVNALTPVASNESAFAPVCPFTESPVAEFSADAGTTYWIAVDGRDGTQGSFELVFSGAPANDAFATPTVVAAEPPQFVSGTLRLASKQAEEPDHAGDPGGHSVWYSWTPSVSGPVDVSTCTSFTALDTVLAVYTGAALGSLTPVAANDDGSPGIFPECSAGNSEVSIDAVAGTTYRIAVDGAEGAVGRFNLQIKGRPANDDFANAQLLPGTPAGIQSTNRLATKQAGEPDHAGNAGGHSVWYSWTPSASGPVVVFTCDSFESGIDSDLAVYTGSSVDALTPVASNDDGPFGCRATDSSVRFDAVVGTTYKIAVDGKGGDEGRFGLQLEAAPANDLFANAKALPASLPISQSDSTRGAGVESGEPNHAGASGGHSVWYSWTPASSGPVAISTCPYGGETPDTALAVYTGDALDALVPLASSDDSAVACSPTGSEVDIDAVAGTTYRIAVDSKGGAGIFSLDLEGRPANDDFATPEVLSSEPLMTGGSTVFASKEPGEPDHAGSPGGHSLWYSWTPSRSGPVDISTCGHGADVDTLLAVYTGSAVDALTPVVSDDDGVGPRPNGLCGPGMPFSDVVFEASAGTTYRIAIDTKNGTGRVGLAFERDPLNDSFAAAQALSPGLPAYGTADTKLASKEPGEPDHAGSPGGHSLWYSWTAPRDGTFSLSTCSYNGGIDTLLAVYTGNSVGSLTPVASNDDGPSDGCRPTDSAVQFSATAGTAYLIAVDGKGGSWGETQLTLEGVQANDDFAKPQTLGDALPDWIRASNRFATKQSGEPDHAGDAGGASVWFKWTAPRTGPVSIDTCGSGFDTLLAVYTGSPVNALSSVASNDDAGGRCGTNSKVGFAATANAVYRIAVDGKGGAQGRIELHLDGAPANDDFDQAEVVPGSSRAYWPGSTTLATKQAGEPDHAGDPGGHSVWYSWTPTRGGTAEIEACTSAFQPLLAVYTGGEVDALTPVPSAESAPGECEAGRTIELSVTAGTTYRVAVDGAAGENGRVQLQFIPPSAHPRLLSVSKAGDGTGSVSSAQTELACGAVCRQWLEVGQTVTLVATPEPGSAFAGWSGGGCAGTAPCQVSVNADTGVTATFEVAGSGGGEPSSGSDGSGSGTGSGGGGSAGGGVPGGGANPPAAPPRSPKPKCRAGFKAKTVHGKRRCVKKPKRQHQQKKTHHR